ncbi:MAG: hypothetical protein WBI82_01850 [Sphaerochaeta sp.]
MIEAEVKIIGTDTIMVALDRAQAPRGIISKAGIRLVGNLAAAGRGVLMDTFTNDSGSSSLHYNNMHWRSMKGKPPLGRNAAGHFDRRGPKHRLIHYSLKSRGNVKSAHLSSYPMNFWERNTKAGRPGKWIMTVKLAPLVAAKGPKYAEEAERQIEAEMNSLMKGGK